MMNRTHKIVTLLIVMLINVCLVQSQTIKKVKMDELVKLIQTSTQPLVVNFWASWCQPCIHEIPWFEKNINADKSGNIKLILVSLDYGSDYPKVLTDFVKQQGYTSTVLWLNETDPGSFCPKIDAKWDGAIPATIMVNNKKKYKQFYLQQLPEAKLQQALQQLVQ
jgi:thiol-disulfide isomerase/thioredoxin